MQRLISPRWRRRAKRLLRLDRRGGILMYHRICHTPFDPWDLCVTPENFDAHMASVAAHRSGRRLESFSRNAPLDVRGRSIAVTFDDGYADNLTNAVPVLERHDIPATIFIVPARIDCGREFWWDGLCRAIFAPEGLPSKLELCIDGMTLAFDIAPDGPEAGANDAAFRADEGDAATPRQALYLDIYERLFRQSPAVQDAVIDALLDWSEVGPPPPESLPLTGEQLAELVRHPLIAIGNHTANHQPLDGVPAAIARREVLDGQSALAAMTGQGARTFSFPYGRMASSAITAVRASGATLATTSINGIVTPLTARYKLPRIQVTDDDGPRFLVRLREDYALMEA